MSEKTARDELAQLRQALRVRLGGPERVERERIKTAADVEIAKQRLTDVYAQSEHPDPNAENQARQAVVDAERLASRPWEQRAEGSRVAITRARADIVEFVRERWGDLVDELLPESIEAQAELAAVLDQAEVALERYANVRHEWASVLPLAGRATGELPAIDVAGIQAALPEEVPVPAPPVDVVKPVAVAAGGSVEQLEDE